MLQQTEHYYNIISLLRQNSPVIKYMLCYVISNAYCSNLLNRDKKIEAEDFNSMSSSRRRIFQNRTSPAKIKYQNAEADLNKDAFRNAMVLELVKKKERKKERTRKGAVKGVGGPSHVRLITIKYNITNYGN